MPTHKSLQEFERLATEQGWDVAQTAGGHMAWRSPEGNLVRTSSTPSDEGIIRTIKNDLSKAGLILDRSEAKRLKKAIRRGETLPNPITGEESFPLMALDWNRPQKPLVEWTDEEVFQAIDHFDRTKWGDSNHDIDFLSRRERKAYADMIRHCCDYGVDDPYWPQTCECGYSGECKGDVTLALYLHLGQNRDHNPTPPEGHLSMKRDMAVRPPARERLDCPFCSEWFWITQPDALATHAKLDHVKAQCPYCQDWFSTVKGGLGKHMKACPKGGEQAAEAAKVIVAEAEPELVVPLLVPPLPVCAGGCGKTTVAQSGYCDECENILLELHAEEMATAAQVAAAPLPRAPTKKRGMGKPRRKQPQHRTPPVPAEAPAEPLSPVLDGSPYVVPKLRELERQAAEAEQSVMTDDELFTLLEMVLDGPVTLDRETFGAVTAWMEATRKLFAIKHRRGS